MNHTFLGGLLLNGWRERKGLSRQRKQLELRVRQEVLGVYRAEVHCGCFSPQKYFLWKYIQCFHIFKPTEKHERFHFKKSRLPIIFEKFESLTTID